MNLGPLNRKGILYRNTPTIGEGGANVDHYTVERELPLTLVEEDAMTKLVEARLAEATDTIWMTRWFDGLVTGMQIIFEGRTYRLTKCIALGRREGWRIHGLEIA